MEEFRRALENASILFVVIFSAPLAALLVAVFLLYLYIVFAPSAPGNTAELRDLFAMVYAVLYLTICFFAIKGS